MARRGFLDYVLGGAVGGLEGLAQKRAAEDEKKRMADAAALDQARFLISSGFRVAPDAYNTEDPAARSILPSLEMPSTAPPSATRAGGALSAALNRGFGVDATKPSLSRPSFGAAPLELDNRTTRMTEVLGRGQEARAAQEAIAASVDLGGGMKVRFNAPESAAQVAARTMEANKKANAVKQTTLFNAWMAAGAKPEEANAYSNAGIAVPANRLAAPVKKLKPWEEQGFASEKEFRAYKSRNPEPASASSQPTQEELDEADAAFAGPLGPFMKQTYDALLARGDKRSPAALRLAAYRELKARAGLPVEAGGMRKPAENAVVGYLSGGVAGFNPAAAGIPGGAPAAAAPVVPVAPVVPPKPAPAPIADQALEEDRRLYDAGVAKYGSARMLAEFGPRK